MTSLSNASVKKRNTVLILSKTINHKMLNSSNDLSEKLEIYDALSIAALNEEQRAALDVELSWLSFRIEFERKMGSEVMLRDHCRNIFESDMICSLIVDRWLKGSPITLKDLATYFQTFVSDVTVKRHVDDMEAAGALVRVQDAADKRRMLLIPTEKEAEPARMFLQGRIDSALRHGFVYDPERAKAQR